MRRAEGLDPFVRKDLLTDSISWVEVSLTTLPCVSEVVTPTRERKNMNCTKLVMGIIGVVSRFSVPRLW